jgi:hypothetical protein
MENFKQLNPNTKRRSIKIKAILLSLLLVLMVTPTMRAQNNDLNIFGYYQLNYTNFDVKFNGEKSLEVNSFLMQQMNLFFQKNFNTELSSFVNLEFTNSFSFQDTSGGFKIQEAWLKYSPSSLFNVKAGLLIPRFNNFNEIKNRTVLLPYIYRPVAYETYFFNQFGTGEFVPTSANLQIYGEIPVNDLYLNYAVFYGNSETKMLNTNSSFWGPGQDPTPYKLVGGRIGVEYNDLQFGASMTYDRKHLDQYNNGFSTSDLGLGYVPRTRLGAYLNYSIAGFELEGELIKVTYDLTQGQKATLAANPFNPQNFDKTYYHINLLYNITDDLSAYTGYDYLKGEDNWFISSGLKILNFGASYKATSAVLIKAQYTHQMFTLGSDGTRNDYLVGASIYF